MTKPIIARDNIQLNVKIDNKWDAIKASGMILFKQGYVTEEYLEDMVAREHIATAYIGNNVAIPHGIDGSEKHILHSGISFIQVPEGVKFDDNIAYLLIGIAGKDGSHIEILSKIALLLMDMNVVEKLKTTDDINYILSLFDSFNN